MATKQYCLIVILFSLFIISCTEDDTEDSDNLQPEACFELANSEFKVDDELTFTNCSQNASKFVWDFGDGNSSTQRDPSHIFSQQGDYEVILLAGEDKNNDGVLNQLDNPDSISKIIKIDPNRTSIDLTIKDANSWTIENPELLLVVGADAKLYTSQSSIDSKTPDFVAKSDENGKAVFYDLENGNYYLSVEMGDSKSSKDGFLIYGVFQTQEDIDNSAPQDGAVIGGIKYTDVNGDGLISDDDKAQFRFITIPNDEPYVRNIIIGK
ncbi:PKD domain-containing protein [Fulvivirga sp. M361]|uniref:PKD domain-containing protein n=1 Tax=Fulvivirga sp. M361 TaxID=2594266 RepID=UPI001179E736|nr:PKD domain-containing protein [Fulvivirga sp. M361]TRX59986.1 PKD domain-containing protein [Fulvivirga sp. M361]